jgi:uncharacterized protein YcfL
MKYLLLLSLLLVGGCSSSQAELVHKIQLCGDAGLNAEVTQDNNLKILTVNCLTKDDFCK